MIIATYALRGARAVRTATIVLALIMLLSVVAAHAFVAQYGKATSIAVLDSTASGDPLAVAVAAQEANGRQCSAQPTLTDIILFEDDSTRVITTMTFDAAIAASAARAGWVRRYCL